MELKEATAVVHNQLEISESNRNHLTGAEMGKLWAIYNGNTMSQCVLSYYLQHIGDEEIKAVVEFALSLSKSFIKDIKTFFEQADFPIPVGFTEEDVNLEAPRLYYDEFYLHYLKYLAKAGMSIYSVAVPLVTREDVRTFFVNSLDSTIKLMNMINDVLKKKGKLMNPPIISPPKTVDFVKKQSFLNGFIGDVRPLHGLEIAHLYDNIQNDTASKALLIGFSQVAHTEKIKQYFLRGKKINTNHIQKATGHLNKGNLPAPSLIDHLVTTSTMPPFSEKLMVYHKIDMFSMKIRSYANGASLNGRRDIGAFYAKCLLDVSLYVEDGANIMIDHGWMEQPPEAVDRERLSQ